MSNEKERKESFVFYRSFYEAICDVPLKYRSKVYEAVFEYVFDDVEPSLSGVPSAMFKLIQPQLDAAAKRYEASKKGAKYGKLGGRPKKEEAPEEGKEKPLKGSEKKPLKGNETKTLNANANYNSNDNANANANANASPFGDGASDASAGAASVSSVPPSLEEVKAYVRENGLSVDPKEFFDRYEANGWTAGDEPIRNWQAVLRGWDTKEKFFREKKMAKNKFNNFDQRQYSGDYWVDLERQLLAR